MSRVSFLLYAVMLLVVLAPAVTNAQNTTGNVTTTSCPSNSVYNPISRTCQCPAGTTFVSANGMCVPNAPQKVVPSPVLVPPAAKSAVTTIVPPTSTAQKQQSSAPRTLDTQTLTLVIILVVGFAIIAIAVYLLLGKKTPPDSMFTPIPPSMWKQDF